MSSRYREVEVSGSPRELGRAVGEAARDEIRGFCEIALERVNLTVNISRTKAMQIAASSIAYVEDYAPDMMEEMRGMSDASGVSLEELMLLQVRNQLRSEDAGCTSFALGSTATSTSTSLIGQNWDNDPELDEFNIVLTRRPAGKPALMNISQAGLIAYIGLNDSGISLCLNTLPAPSRELGVPHYFTVRGIYESDSLEGAADAVRRAPRAIPANIMMSTPEGPADFEITIDDVHILRDPQNRLVTHTNHCLHPDLVSINEEFAELINSGPRLERTEQVLRTDTALGVEHLKGLLSDHENHPRSICRHPNDDSGTGIWKTVFSVIMEPEQGRMHLSRGTPCNNPYEVYELS
ncbi:MAG: C45 family autoproteolytic acyltransferase/hydrolase [Planctomycetota bacterium]|nr:C45 family autoproteolytic acyltransferase/hydrolase [Planctomycetota bacterium]MDA1142272.1 C45 family autoproteolytic acyltransferase/hydrolase [Planctomycetota bacterium]